MLEVDNIRDREEQQFLTKLGKRIRRFRINKDWSQERLGFKSKLDRTYIGGIERGESNPTALNLKKIADALEIPLEKMLSEDQE